MFSFTNITNIEPHTSQNDAKDHAAISICNLNVFADKQPILKDVNLVIPPKQVTCIIGPSGCGKTTLLRSLNRLHDNNSRIRVTGCVKIGEDDIYQSGVDVPALRRKMGLLAQRPTVLPMSIFENVAYGLRIGGLNDKAELKKEVEENLKAVGLWEEVKDRLHNTASQLSIGQQQRLCLARAIAVDPLVLLGDEATSALDPIASRKVEELLVTLKSRMSVVLVTHTLRQAKRIADYVAFMYMGEIIEFGEATKIFTHPEKELTNDYLAGSFS